MKRIIQSVLPVICLAAALVPSRSAFAQAINSDSALAVATPENTDSTPRPRPISATTAAHLSATAPKYVPPAIVEATVAVDLREIEKPQNTIVRLPNYVVADPKPLVFKDRELLTPAGRLQLGLKRYPGLRFGSLPFLSNDGWAFAMVEEDFRLERKSEMEDLVGLVSSPTAHARAADETQQVFMRKSW